jgi:hypothetical protein
MKTPISVKETAYNADQAALDFPPGAEDGYWYLARNNHLYNQLKKNGLDESPILEVGCGSGIVVEFLRKQGLDCKGCDLSDQAAKKSPYLFLSTDANDMEESYRKKVKTLLLLDVIEHIEEPVPFLKKLQTSFPNLEYFVIAVPARKELWSNYDVFFGHFRRYDMKMLRQEMKEIGAKVLVMHYFFKLLYLPGWLTVKLLGKRNLQVGAPQSSFSKALNRIPAAMIRFSDWILPRQWWGSSLLTIVRINKQKG